jgi:hypothetical protein
MAAFAGIHDDVASDGHGRILAVLDAGFQSSVRESSRFFGLSGVIRLGARRSGHDTILPCRSLRPDRCVGKLC